MQRINNISAPVKPKTADNLYVKYTAQRIYLNLCEKQEKELQLNAAPPISIAHSEPFFPDLFFVRVDLGCFGNQGIFVLFYYLFVSTKVLATKWLRPFCLSKKR